MPPNDKTGVWIENLNEFKGVLNRMNDRLRKQAKDLLSAAGWQAIAYGKAHKKYIDRTHQLSLHWMVLPDSFREAEAGVFGMYAGNSMIYAPVLEKRGYDTMHTIVRGFRSLKPFIKRELKMIIEGGR